MLDEFIGNERQVAGLRHAIAAGQVGHAILFTGPDQIGKRTMALAVAQVIQCQRRGAGEARACGECANCRKIAHGNHPDTLSYALPRDRQSYSIDQVRELIEETAMRPTEGRRRIFVIPDLELMLTPANQAMLKVLEEPPPTAMILLTSASAELLLPTIRSRCQEVALTPVAPEILAAGLAQRGALDPERALEVARLSGGLPGWAIAAIEHPEAIEARRTLLRDLNVLVHAGRAERIAAAGTFAADKATAQRALVLWLPWWRDVVLAAHGDEDILRFAGDRAAIVTQARACGAAAAELFVRALVRALRELDQNANPRLVFEVLLLELPRLS